MRAISCASASLVSGPVATIVIASRAIEAASWRRNSIRGLDSIAAVTSRANTSRSTVSACPPGTRDFCAQLSSQESSRRSSSFSSQGSVFSDSLFSELLHTSSASRSVLCAGDDRTGRISISVQLSPARATCNAASQPASPPPRISIRDIQVQDTLVPGLVDAQPGLHGLRNQIGRVALHPVSGLGNRDQREVLADPFPGVVQRARK